VSLWVCAHISTCRKTCAGHPRSHTLHSPCCSHPCLRKHGGAQNRNRVSGGAPGSKHAPLTAGQNSIRTCGRHRLPLGSAAGGAAVLSLVTRRTGKTPGPSAYNNDCLRAARLAVLLRSRTAVTHRLGQNPRPSARQRWARGIWRAAARAAGGCSGLTPWTWRRPLHPPRALRARPAHDVASACLSWTFCRVIPHDCAIPLVWPRCCKDACQGLAAHSLLAKPGVSGRDV
jgi:hypothetical protein